MYGAAVPSSVGTANSTFNAYLHVCVPFPTPPTMTGLTRVSWDTLAPLAFTLVATARAKTEPIMELKAPVSGIIEKLATREFRIPEGVCLLLG